jgi:GH35 family endo-1,4-beta-xylanase
MEEEKIYQSAVTLWGQMFQRLMVIEECAELISALCKEFRGRIDDNDVVEEAVDVQLMVNQLRFMLNREEEWAKQMKLKLDRLEERIKGANGCL